MTHSLQYLHNQLHRPVIAEIAQTTVQRALAIQQIAAPTFHELPRAQFIAQSLQTAGVQQVTIDGVYNVIGVIHGRTHGRGLMLSAHSDTVFAHDTNLAFTESKGLLRAPGIGDNSLGVAALFAVIDWLRQSGVTLERDLWIVVPSREEGLGDLGGMREAFATLKDRVSAVINVEGLALGNVYHAGIAVKRLQIIAHADGGHSWLHFGKPSAVHTIVEIGHAITQIEVPMQPRTTYNLGMIAGGESINSLASHADVWLDMRSETPEGLAALEAHVMRIIQQAQSTEVSITVNVVGERPAGWLDPSHPLVTLAMDALAQVGIRGGLETGSTDGNIPLSHHCPTVTVGVTHGGNAHRIDEYIEIAPIEVGIRQLILLVQGAQALLT
jgi:tripeptide aminopeptidase